MMRLQEVMMIQIDQMNNNLQEMALIALKLKRRKNKLQNHMKYRL